MELTSDHRYRFDLEPADLWSRLAATDEYQRWWPWLREFTATGLVAGDAWDCRVQPPLPYSLRFTIVLDEVVVAARIAATVTGDIRGSAQLDIHPDDEGASVRLRSSLAPTNGAFRLAATMLRPIARWGHDWVLDTGARQFASAVAS